MSEKELYYTPLDTEELHMRCSRIRHVALDMDGTIYLGNELFDYTRAFLDRLRFLDISYSFLTNNPTRSVDDYLRKLSAMGIEVPAERMFTSSRATIEHIRHRYPEVRRLFVLGTESMTDEFRRAGFDIADDDPADRPDMLVVAFDTTLTYPRLCRAAWWASHSDIPYIATNPDRVCPTNQPTVLVDCGSICQAIEHATGRRPDIVIGKPSPGMLNTIMDYFKLQPEQVAMVGDRIYTDVASARAAGALGVLTLSGETTLDTALNADPQPLLTVNDISIFGLLLEAAHRL